MKASPDLIEFLRAWEGPPSFEPRNDPVSHGTCDIGYGHVCDPDHPPITAAEATALLSSDADLAARAVSTFVTVTVKQHEFDALVSLGFNIGRNALGTSTLIRLLNVGDREGAAAQFIRWNKSGGKVITGLTKRRVAERQIFLHADYTRRP